MGHGPGCLSPPGSVVKEDHGGTCVYTGLEDY